MHVYACMCVRRNTQATSKLLKAHLYVFNVCVCMYKYLCVCMLVPSKYLGKQVYTKLHTALGTTHLCVMCVHVYVCACVCVRLCMYAFVFVVKRLPVCVHVCTYVCMYACVRTSLVPGQPRRFTQNTRHLACVCI